MDRQEIDRRFEEAMAQASLLKHAMAMEPSAVSVDDDLNTEQDETSQGVEEKHQAAGRAEPRAPTVINLFQHPDGHPYVLGFSLLQKYGPEWMEWEPEIVEMRILADFPTNSVSDLTMEKLNAVKTVLYTDSYWKSWEIFVVCTMPFNNIYPDFEVMQVPTVAQCAVSVDIVNRMREGLEWSDEMKAYLEVVHRHDGVMCSIEPLDFVEVDSEPYPVDCAEVMQRWPEVRRTRKAPTEESVEAEQLRRLLIVQEALDEHRARIKNQLRLMLHG